MTLIVRNCWQLVSICWSLITKLNLEYIKPENSPLHELKAIRNGAHSSIKSIIECQKPFQIIIIPFLCYLTSIVGSISVLADVKLKLIIKRGNLNRMFQIANNILFFDCLFYCWYWNEAINFYMNEFTSFTRLFWIFRGIFKL